jgi:cation transport ATPase
MPRFEPPSTRRATSCVHSGAFERLGIRAAVSSARALAAVLAGDAMALSSLFVVGNSLRLFRFRAART